MSVFIAHSNQDKPLARRIAEKLRSRDIEVFLDEDSLPAGQSYDARIRAAVMSCDVFMFLVSEASIKTGAYALTELGIAKQRWPNPAGRVLPVAIEVIELSVFPPYLTEGVTVLQPKGNVAVEAADAVQQLLAQRTGLPPQPPGSRIAGESRRTGRRPFPWLPLLAVAASVAVVAGIVRLSQTPETGVDQSVLIGVPSNSVAVDDAIDDLASVRTSVLQTEPIWATASATSLEPPVLLSSPLPKPLPRPTPSASSRPSAGTPSQPAASASTGPAPVAQCSAQVGGAGGETPGEPTACAEDEVVVGIFGSRWVDVLTTFGIECAKLNVAAGVAGVADEPRKVLFTTREAPPEAKPFRQRCAPGRVVDGFLLSTTALGHLTVLGGAQIICRSIAVKDGQMQSTGAGTEPAGSPLSGVEASPCGCAADELVVGVRGRFGGYVDSLGLRCGKRQMKP